MSLFDKLKLKQDEKQDIIRYLNNPTLSDWNNICNIRITPRHALWFAVAMVKPDYFKEWNDHTMMWRTFPDSILLGNAIKKARSAHEAILEDMLLFPGPSAA